VHVAIRKDEQPTLPRMGATDANIIRITGGNFPTRRNVNRLLAIENRSVIVNFVRVKRHANVGAIALQEGGGGKFERACAEGERSQARSWCPALQPLGPVEQREQGQGHKQEQEQGRLPP
jgi:hypothetical protein